MPELPEVESIRLSLLPAVMGRTISQVEILTPGVFLAGNLPMTSWRIAGLERRGKFLIFRLAGTGHETARLVVHLRMTGQLLIQKEDLPLLKHTHVRMKLVCSDTGQAVPAIWLIYHDTRRFGRLWLLPDRSANSASTSPGPDPGASAGAREQTSSGVSEPAMLARLGPEPLDERFGAALLAEGLKRHSHASLKAALLDQSTVAGLGNIYADEVLFAAKLHPARQVNTLTSQETADLAASIRKVIIKAIACQGTSLRDYVDAWNQKGEFQDCLMVYGRAGQPCRVCGNTIQKMRLAGRTTCWCPHCQPEHVKAAFKNARP